MQDAVREFLQGRESAHSAIWPTVENAKKVVEAGEHLAHGLALLLSTRFGDVDFDPSPIYAANLSRNTTTPWRVGFVWHGNRFIEPVESEELEDDEDDEDEEP